MKVEIATEKVMRMQRERTEINGLDMDDIIWTYRGKPIDVPEQLQRDFGLTGLNNIDFITSNIIPESPWLDDILRCNVCDKNKRKDEGRFNSEYVGGKGMVSVFECFDCIDRRWEESAEAVRKLKNRLEVKDA